MKVRKKSPRQQNTSLFVQPNFECGGTGGFFFAPTGLTTKCFLDICSTLGFPGFAPRTHHGHCFPFCCWPPWGMAGIVAGRSPRLLIHLSGGVGGVTGGRAVPTPVSLCPLSYRTCIAQHTRAPFKHSYVVCAVAICTYVHACMYVFLCELDYVHNTTAQHHTRRHVTHRCNT